MMNMKDDEKSRKLTKPNILIFMVDEQRFPPAYENEELKKWRKENLKTQELLRKNGMEFLNHYVGSTACIPSRTTLYTGQYPSLHGVTQTTGGASPSFAPNVFWLDPQTVPTFGNYFRAAGYRTFWKGKWHASEPDILIPGTHDALPSYDPNTGVPDAKLEKLYLDADRLDEYGFSGWLGPEPHGSNPRNSASSAGVGTSGRDEVYAREIVDLIQSLEAEDKNDPWLIVSSFVNPHDITLYGEITKLLARYSTLRLIQLSHISLLLPHPMNHYLQNRRPNKITKKRTKRHSNRQEIACFTENCTIRSINKSIKK